MAKIINTRKFVGLQYCMSIIIKHLSHFDNFYQLNYEILPI